MVIVLSIGIGVVAVGTTLLFFMFRAFGEAHRGGHRHIVLMAALIAFVFLCIGAILYFT